MQLKTISYQTKIRRIYFLITREKLSTSAWNIIVEPTNTKPAIVCDQERLRDHKTKNDKKNSPNSKTSWWEVNKLFKCLLFKLYAPAKLNLICTFLITRSISHENNIFFHCSFLRCGKMLVCDATCCRFMSACVKNVYETLKCL